MNTPASSGRKRPKEAAIECVAAAVADERSGFGATKMDAGRSAACVNKQPPSDRLARHYWPLWHASVGSTETAQPPRHFRHRRQPASASSAMARTNNTAQRAANFFITKLLKDFARPPTPTRWGHILQKMLPPRYRFDSERQPPQSPWGSAARFLPRMARQSHKPRRSAQPLPKYPPLIALRGVHFKPSVIAADRSSRCACAPVCNDPPENGKTQALPAQEKIAEIFFGVKARPLQGRHLARAVPRLPAVAGDCRPGVGAGDRDSAPRRRGSGVMRKRRGTPKPAF